MPVPDRTREAALQVLLTVREEVAEDMGESGELLSPDLVRDVFDQAWRSQFEEERRHARRGVREIVSDLIASIELGADS